MSVWYLIKLPALCAWIALLEADAVHVGQWMLSRPILLGPLTGMLAGEWRTGLILGVLTELFCLERAPAGGAGTLSGAVAAATAVLLAAGPQGLPLEAAFPAGLFFGLGHGFLGGRVREWRARLTEDARRALELGGAIDWERTLLLGLAAHIGMTAVWVYAATAVGGPVLGVVFLILPDCLRNGLGFAFRFAPWIALATLTHALARSS